MGLDVITLSKAKKYAEETAEGAGAVQGKPGKDGNGIVSITKESSTGKIDTYKIFFTDNTSTKFTVTNATTVDNLSQLNNDTGFITNTVNNLVNYYTKTDTYSKNEISKLLQNISAGLSVMVVTTLPTENISATTIYLVNEGIDDNSYEQWMYIAGQWASLGSTTIDLSAYYTKNDIDHLLLGYITASSLTTILANYVKKAELASVATSGSYNDLKDLPTIPTTEGLATEKYVDDAIHNIQCSNLENVDLSDYYKKSETYSKTEVDNLIPDVTEGISPTIVENSNNTDKIYKLDITDANGTLTTPNLKGENGKDGKSISAISKDENNNIIVTFSDGSTQNLGKLNIDVSADFLATDGFGNLRYYNDTLQYYNSSTSEWINIVATTDNQLVVKLSPNPMQKMTLATDAGNQCYKIIFKEPKDTIVDGQLLCAVEGIKFVRKLGSEPTDIDDGILVFDYKRREFSNYEHKTYADTSFIPSDGENWYYKAFPYSTAGFISNSSMNVTNAIFKSHYLYAFTIDQNESNPSNMISYPDNCDNTYFQSAYMDYATDTFNYGDWGDAFFMPKPCMLKYDGTVGYYLNPNDYTLKEDGTPSDIVNVNYGGNAMMQFPKIYRKIVDHGDDTATIYISNKKLDEDFKCWSNIDSKGNEIPYFYMSIYNGYSDGTRLRSLSGKVPMNNETAQQEVNLSKANNLTSDVIWYTDVFTDIDLLRSLVLLIGKSTDSQTIFGTGNNSNPYISTSNTGIIETGTMDKRGLFYGSQDNVSGVKVFGIEHLWGNIWRRIAGWNNDKGVQKIKLTYGQEDGSTVSGYNFDGSGYITISDSVQIASGNYISKMIFTKNGMIPKTVNGSATTGYCDGFWFNNSQSAYARVGGPSSDGLIVGVFCSDLTRISTMTSVSSNTSISCKPLAGGVS